ncbi:MAG: sugar ABC transporter permease [Chloroflexi bacterium]|nr:MAG: sugar ABC transporter permease [Chloroflexota bacterium]
MKSPQTLVPLIFIMPAVVVLVVGLIVPVANAFYLSFFDWDMGTPWDSAKSIGLENYTRMLADESVRNSVWVTLKYTLATTSLEMVLGIGLALALEKPIRGASLFRTIFILPLMVSPIIVGLIWRYMLDGRTGVIPYYVERLGEIMPPLQSMGFIRHAYLADTNLALPAAVGVDIWQWTPFIFIIILAGLQALPSDVMQAAYIDGATWFQMTVFVKLPMMLPLIIVTLLMRLIDVFRALEVLFIMTFGGPAQATEVLSVKIYKTAFAAQNLGYASTISMLLIAITFVLSVIVLIYNNPTRQGGK